MVGNTILNKAENVCANTKIFAGTNSVVELAKAGDFPVVPNVINNLTSNSTTDALSANQSKVLNDKLSNISSLSSKMCELPTLHATDVSFSNTYFDATQAINLYTDFREADLISWYGFYEVWRSSNRIAGGIGINCLVINWPLADRDDLEDFDFQILGSAIDRTENLNQSDIQITCTTIALGILR